MEIEGNFEESRCCKQNKKDQSELLKEGTLVRQHLWSHTLTNWKGSVTVCSKRMNLPHFVEKSKDQTDSIPLLFGDELS